MKSKNKNDGKQTITNDEKLKRLKIRKLLWYGIIVFGLLTILLSLFSLFRNWSPLYAVVCFVIEVILSKWRNSIDPEIGKRS